ncbi:MAG: S8 family serine peptidase [bacterium]|nr:S8 family serine peptidase [bacterium]
MAVLAICCSLVSTPAHADSGKSKSSYQLAPDTDISHIVIKYQEGSGVTLRDGLLASNPTTEIPTGTQSQVATDLDVIESTVAAHDYRLQRTFDAFSEDQLDEMHRSAVGKADEALDDLNLFHSLYPSTNVTYAEAEHLVDVLGELEVVEEVYAQPHPGAPHHLTAPDFAPSQGYVDPAPIGVDTAYARMIAGGKGAGVKVVDVEGGWQTTHEDFPVLFSDSGNYNVNEALSWNDHGTAVLGVMGAVDNGSGVTGMVDEATFGVQSLFKQAVVEDPPGIFKTVDEDHLANAIFLAADAVGVGGIVLLEVQYPGPIGGQSCNKEVNEHCYHVAAENSRAFYTAIKHVTTKGVIVVEAAGNGSMDLDNSIYGGRFDRSFRDSGAILVGASQSDARTPMFFSNYGSRVDVHGWGENVTTLGYGDLFDGGHNDRDHLYTAGFSGTSSASPIVTSAAASLQGIVVAAGLKPLDSVGMRSLLSFTSTPQTGDLSKNIGGLPNIRAAYQSLSLTSTAVIEGTHSPDDIRVHVEPTIDGLNRVSVYGSSNHRDGAVLENVSQIEVDTYAGADTVQFDIESQDVRIDLNQKGGENTTSAKIGLQTPAGSEHAFAGLNLNAEKIEMDIQNRSRLLDADVEFDLTSRDGSVKITNHTMLDTGLTSMNFIGVGGPGSDIIELVELGPGEFMQSGSITAEIVKFNVKGNATLVGGIAPLVDASVCEYTVEGDLEIVGAATIGCDRAKVVITGVITRPTGLVVSANDCDVNEALPVCDPR